MNKNHVSNCFFYYIALIMSQLGISASFMQNGSNNNFLRIAIVMIGVFFLDAFLRSGRRIKRADFVLVFWVACAIFIIIMKMFYFGNLLLVGPLMCIGCFLIVLALVLNTYYFNFLIFFLINTVGAIVLIVSIFTKSNDLWGAVTIGYINPQTIGAWAMIYAVGTLIGLNFFGEKVKHKFLFLLFEIVIYGFMVYITVITDARFSSLCLIALIIFRFLPPLRLIDNVMVRMIIGVSPIILLILTEGIYFIGNALETGESLLNGREAIWLNWIEKLSGSMVLGYDYRYIDANSFYSHNIFIDQLVLFGMVVPSVFFGAIVFILLTKVPRFLVDKNHKNYSRIKYDAFIAFSFVLIASFCEGCFFSVGGGGLFIYSFVPLLVVLSNEKV